MKPIESRFVVGGGPLEELERQADMVGLRPERLEHVPGWLRDTDHGEGGQGGAIAFHQRGTLVGYLPFVYAPSRLPLRLGEMRLLNLPFRTVRVFGDGIVGDGASLAGSAFEALASIPFGIDAITFEETSIEAPLWIAATRSTDSRRFLAVERGRARHHVVEFPASFDAYWKARSSGTRTSLRRRIRELEQRFAKWEVGTFQSASDVPKLFDAVEPVLLKTFHYHLLGQDLTRQNARTRRNLETWATRGWLRAYALFGDGHPIAYVVGFLTGRTYQYEYIGYDPDLRKAAPGNVLLMKIIEDLIANSVADRLDFGAGDAEYKQLFGTRSYEEGRLLLTRRTLYARGAAAAEQLFARGSRAAVRKLEKMGVKRHVKSFFRRVRSSKDVDATVRARS